MCEMNEAVQILERQMFTSSSFQVRIYLDNGTFPLSAIHFGLHTGVKTRWGIGTHLTLLLDFKTESGTLSDH